MLEAKIKFFDIRKCGFYQRAKDTPEFGEITDILSKLKNWAGGFDKLVNTTTYELDPNNPDILNTYFCNWTRNTATKDSLLILWNEVKNDNGAIYGLNPNKAPGSTEMLKTGFGKTPAIPGFPSYFWFIPERNVFATVTFSHSMQGKGQLDRYLNGFLSNKSPYRVINDEGEVIGYSEKGKPTANSPQVMPKFWAVSRKRDELSDELITNLGNIRKLIKREVLNYSVEDDRKYVERLFSKLLKNNPSYVGKGMITHELDYRPSEDELKSIIKNYDDLAVTSSIRNVGFVYKDGKRVMLNGINVATTREIKVSRKDNQIVPAEKLLAALVVKRTDLLRVLDEPDDESSED
jgi:hypothetical protein